MPKKIIINVYKCSRCRENFELESYLPFPKCPACGGTSNVTWEETKVKEVGE